MLTLCSMSWRFAILAVVVACRREAPPERKPLHAEAAVAVVDAPPAPPPREIDAALPDASVAVVGPRPSCDRAARAKLTVAMKQLDAVPAEVRVEILDCIGGNFEQPGFYVVAHSLLGRGKYEERYGLAGFLGVDGAALAKFAESGRVYKPLERDRYEVADLDGDGHDEVIAINHAGEPEYQDRTLSVIRLVGGHMVRIEGPVIFMDHAVSVTLEPEPPSACAGTVKLDGAHIVVTATQRDGPAEGCLPVGKHVLVLRGNRLVPE